MPPSVPVVPFLGAIRFSSSMTPSFFSGMSSSFQPSLADVFSNSFRDVMQGLVFCSEMENRLLRIVAGPVSHGLMRMVKEPGKSAGEDGGAGMTTVPPRAGPRPITDKRPPHTQLDQLAPAPERDQLSRHLLRLVGDLDGMVMAGSHRAPPGTVGLHLRPECACRNESAFLLGTEFAEVLHSPLMVDVNSPQIVYTEDIFRRTH